MLIMMAMSVPIIHHGILRGTKLTSYQVLPWYPTQNIDRWNRHIYWMAIGRNNLASPVGSGSEARFLPHIARMWRRQVALDAAYEVKAMEIAAT